MGCQCAYINPFVIAHQCSLHSFGQKQKDEHDLYIFLQAHPLKFNGVPHEVRDFMGRAETQVAQFRLAEVFCDLAAEREHIFIP